MRVLHKPGVFTAEERVVFLNPVSVANPNSLLILSGSLSSVAGSIGKIVDPTLPDARVVSPTVSLADEGVRNGYRVWLPDDGGQWSHNFDQPVLDVQVVGASVAAVTTQMTTLITKINTELKTMQVNAGVAANNMITTRNDPAVLTVVYLTGSRVRALAATLAVGLSITVLLELVIGRVIRRRQRAI